MVDLPADDAGEPDLPAAVECPFCDGTETELHSAFGSALSVATYWCRACRTPFERFKWTAAAPPAPPARRALP